MAPCGVPEDTPEALYVALINAQAHEALEWVQINGKPYFDPHTEVGDYVLEQTPHQVVGVEDCAHPKVAASVEFLGTFPAGRHD